MMGARIPSSPSHCILRVRSLSPILLLPPSFLLLCCPFSRSPACLPSCRSLPTAGEYFPSQALDLHYRMRFSQPPRGRNYHYYLHCPDKPREVKELVQGHTASKWGEPGLESGAGAVSRARAPHPYYRLCFCQIPPGWSLEAPGGRSGQGSAPGATAQRNWLCRSPHSSCPCSRLAVGTEEKEKMQPALCFPPVPQAKQGHHFLHHGTGLCHQPLLCDQLPAQPPPPCLLRSCSPAGRGLPGSHHLSGTVGSAGALETAEATDGGRGNGLGLPHRSYSLPTHDCLSPRSGPVLLPMEPPCWPTAPTNTSCTGFLKRSRRGSPLDEHLPLLGPPGTRCRVERARQTGLLDVAGTRGVGVAEAGQPEFHRELLCPSLDK